MRNKDLEIAVIEKKTLKSRLFNLLKNQFVRFDYWFSDLDILSNQFLMLLAVLIIPFLMGILVALWIFPFC